MKAVATVTLAHHGLELRCPAAGLAEDRPLAAEDCQRLGGWAARYRTMAGQEDPHDLLLALGQEMHAWLDGGDAFLTRTLEVAAAPLVIEIAVGKSDCDKELAKALLDAPWEILASDGEFWAQQPTRAFCPIRRIGKPGNPAPASPHRLGLVFMAAAPRGADTLDYEAEEVCILDATHDLGMALDLTVEESGTLDLLAACVAREKPEVVQLSCHGTLHPVPSLLLEDDVGESDPVGASQLVTRLVAHAPRLVFLSACETAQADPVLRSLASSLVMAGAPAVLGWAAPVRDREATLFAGALYRFLAQGSDLFHALAYARLELAAHAQLAPAGSRDWHLARLFVGGNGGGALATAGGPHRHVGQGQAVKTCLSPWILSADDPRSGISGIAPSGHGALDDVADGTPSDPHGCGYRGLVRLLSQVGYLVLEVSAEASLGLCPGDHLDDHAPAPTAHSAQGISQDHQHPAGVEVSPVPRATVMNLAHQTPAARAARHSRGRRNLDQKAEQVEINRQHAGVWNLEDESEHAGCAHELLGLWVLDKPHDTLGTHAHALPISTSASRLRRRENRHTRSCFYEDVRRAGDSGRFTPRKGQVHAQTTDSRNRSRDSQRRLSCRKGVPSGRQVAKKFLCQRSEATFSGATGHSDWPWSAARGAPTDHQ